jgi:S-layer family protein
MKCSHLLMVTLLTLLALPATAQDVHRASSAADNSLSASPETYGTSSRTYLALSAWNFVPINSTTTYQYTLNPFGIYAANPGATNAFHAGLQLPEGALVDYLEVIVCDTTATGHVGAWILKANQTGPYTTLAAFPYATTDAEAPGCVVRPLTLSTPPAGGAPFTVDNASNVYTFEVGFTEGFDATSSLELIGARVGYKLQISPDPATATFADVPVGHPFHRFVEALYASGITGGCGGGNFCPDQPVTRGQMAVFLAGALGLHWAP